MANVVDNLVDTVGAHQTGAAQYAVILSENSRVDVTPYEDGDTHLSFIRYGSQNMNGRKRGFIVKPGVVAMNYGYYNTVIGRSGTTLLIDVENFGAYRIENLDPNTSLLLMVFDVMSEELKPVVVNLAVDGDFYNCKTGGTVINNIFLDRVIVKFIARIPYRGSEYTLPRNNETSVLGITYSDARNYMIAERRRVLGEERFLSFIEVQRQTHVQIPSRHDRSNTGKALKSRSENAPDGSGLSTASDYLYRLIDTNHIVINNMNKPEYNLYLNNNYKQRITKFEDLSDVWNMPLGPMEASRANVVYAGLISDGNYVPVDSFEGTLKNRIRTKIDELGSAGIAATYLLAMQKIEDALGGTFSERLVNMNVAEASFFGENNVTYLTQTSDFLQLAQMENLSIEFDTSFALGSVLSYGRRGLAQQFLNHFNGKGSIPSNYAVKQQYNEMITGDVLSSVVDDTTGYFLFDADLPKDILPVGLHMFSPDEGQEALTLVGYTKSYGETDVYKCRPCVINYKWRLNLGHLLMTDILRGEESVDLNFFRIFSYIENVFEMVATNINWYTMHLLLAGWDNIAVPLSETVLFGVPPGDERFLQLQDDVEQYPVSGMRDEFGDKYLDARFSSNGFRISFGVPDISKIVDDKLKPYLGYTVYKVKNVISPFIIPEEANIFVPSTVIPVSKTRSPLQVMQSAIGTNEFFIQKTDGGYSFKEPSWDRFFINNQDRRQALLGYGQRLAPDMSSGALTAIVEQLMKQINSMEERVARIPVTFTGTVKSVFGNEIKVNPDGREIVIVANKVSGSGIGAEDRVFGFETAPGKFGVMKLPIAETFPPNKDPDENAWFQAGGE